MQKKFEIGNDAKKGWGMSEKEGKQEMFDKEEVALRISTLFIF